MVIMRSELYHKRSHVLHRVLSHWCEADELSELSCIEINFFEKDYFQAVESRGMYAGHKVLQIFALTSKPNQVRARRSERVGPVGESGCRLSR